MSGQGSNAASKTKSTSQAKTAKQKKWLSEALELYGPQLGQNDPYQGDRVAGLTDLQQTGIGAAGGVGGAFTDPVSAKGIEESELYGGIAESTANLLSPISKPSASGYAPIAPIGSSAGPAGIQASTAVQGASQISPEQYAEFFKSSTSDPARKAFNEETNPAIQEAFAGPGFFGTARSKEIVKQKTDLEDTLSSSLSAGQYENLKRNQQLQESAAQRDIVRDQLDQSRQQFNAEFDRSTEQFAQSLNLSREQFNQSLDKSRDEFSQTLGLNIDNMNTAREKLGFDQALELSDSQANTLTANVALAASQVQGLKELIGIGSVEQTQEQAEIFAAIEQYALDNEITDPENLTILLSLLGLDFSTSSSRTSAKTRSGGGGVGDTG